MYELFKYGRRSDLMGKKEPIDRSLAVMRLRYIHSNTNHVMCIPLILNDSSDWLIGVENKESDFAAFFTSLFANRSISHYFAQRRYKKAGRLASHSQVKITIN